MCAYIPPIDGDYMFAERAPPVETLLDYIDGRVAAKAEIRLVFPDDRWGPRWFVDTVAAVKRHIRSRGYHRVYQFWTDAINFADAALIKGRPIAPGRPGGCWPSPFWDLTDLPELPKPPKPPAPPKPPKPPKLPEPPPKPPAPLAPPRLPEPPPKPPEPKRRRPKTPESADECVVCMDAVPDTMVLPCMHTVVCHKCSVALQNSPNAKVCLVCREPITAVLD